MSAERTVQTFPKVPVDVATVRIPEKCGEAAFNPSKKKHQNNSLKGIVLMLFLEVCFCACVEGWRGSCFFLLPWLIRPFTLLCLLFNRDPEKMTDWLIMKEAGSGTGSTGPQF